MACLFLIVLGVGFMLAALRYRVLATANWGIGPAPTPSTTEWVWIAAFVVAGCVCFWLAWRTTRPLPRCERGKRAMPGASGDQPLRHTARQRAWRRKGKDEGR